MQIKPGDADRFLARPDKGTRVVLLYGPDAGLVAERADAFIDAVVGATTDPFARVRLDSEAVASDPSRLADEAYAISLFGGTRAIRLRVAGPRPIHQSVEAVLRNPPTDAWIVIEAGDLRKTAPLRKLCEGSPNAAAIGCYTETGRAVDALINEELAKAGLAIDNVARTALHELLGDDRLSTRSEVRKLATYAWGEEIVTLDAVRAVIGDGSDLEVDDLVDRAATGDLAGTDGGYRRLRANGKDPSTIGGAVLRHFQLLHRLRAEIDAGGNADAAIGSVSPPVFFKRRPVLAAQLRLWRRRAIEGAMDLAAAAMLQCRLLPVAGDAAIGQVLIAIANRAATGRRP